MTKYPEAEALSEVIQAANHIVVIQADNPDADSLASALALEQILGDMGKEVTLYCGVDLPSYLSYLEGSDRVTNEIPSRFDASIIVDTSSQTLLAQMAKSGAKAWVAAKPVIVIDHHSTAPSIDFAKVMVIHPAVASGELIYELAQTLSWPLNAQAKKLIAIAILSDSLGLMSSSTSERSIHILAELVAAGVDLPEIDSARRETMRREPELVHYKGRLLQRVEFYSDNRIAMITIPWEEIETYSPFYNPPMLVLDDMRLARGTDVAIAFKLYKDGKLTAKIRANYRKAIADKLAEAFGGGGHPYAAGFKIIDGTSYDQVKARVIETATHLLDSLDKESSK